MDLYSQTSTSGAQNSPVIDQLSETLFKVSLTESNKQSLFLQAIEKLDSGREEADLIRRNLRGWAPEVVDSFARRSPNVIIETPFRLVYSGSSDSLYRNNFVARQYLAISYCWHNSQWPGIASSAPEVGQIWPIGQRFAQAILDERGDPREGIWMDQICINQQDDFEKQRAIACMDVIYKTCRKLVVILEDVEVTDEEVAMCRKYDGYESPYKMNQRPRDEAEIRLLISLYEKVASARWWQRSWCFHEFVVGEPWSEKRHQQVHNTVFILGLNHEETLSVTWMTLHAILATVTIQLGHKSPVGRHMNPILSGFSNRTSPILEVGTAKSSFMARFNAVAQTGCSMPGDRLSVCINLVGLGLAYFRDHEPAEDEVYYLATLLSLAAGEKVSLSFANMEPLIVNDKQSWLMRPITAADTTIDKFTFGDVQSIHHVSVDRLEIDLLFFNSAFSGSAEEGIRETYDIFPNAIESTPPPFKAGVGQLSSFFRPDHEMERPRRQFLAAVLAGGPGLAKRLWAQLHDQVVKWDYNTGIFADFVPNNSLQSATTRFLSLLHGKEGNNIEVNSLERDSALGLLTWITDPRSIYWISFLVASIKCTQDGQSALLTAFQLTSHFKTRDSEKEMQVAMPVDLLESKCTWTRAWILMPVDTENGPFWKIVAKALLLGEPNLMDEICRHSDSKEGSSAVALRKRQTIIG